MTPYVALQRQIIDMLFFWVQRKESFLKEILSQFRSPDFEFTEKTREDLASHGLYLPVWDWHEGDRDLKQAVVEIFLEQVDDSSDEIVVKNLLGFPFQNHSRGYDLEDWVKYRGSGNNYLRTPRVAQPRALQVGDHLITGERVIDPPREGGNGTVYVHLSGPKGLGTWLGLPSRIPLALLTKEDELPGLTEE